MSKSISNELSSQETTDPPPSYDEATREESIPMRPRVPRRRRRVKRLTLNGKFGKDPAYGMCPLCGFEGYTYIDTKDTETHLLDFILCCMGLWCCLCLPYTCERCKEAKHYCSNCNKFLGLGK